MKTKEILTSEEAHKLIKYLLCDYGRYATVEIRLRNYTMAVLMLDAGLRVGEVIKLKVSDLWYEDQPVQRLLVRGDVAKLGIERIIPMTDRLTNAIAKTYTETAMWRSTGVDYFAFTGSGTATAITARRVQQIIGTAASSSIRRWINPHALRHTFATRLMQRTNIRIVQQLLGHKSITSTQVYTHPNTDDLTKAIKSLDD